MMSNGDDDHAGMMDAEWDIVKSWYRDDLLLYQSFFVVIRHYRSSRSLTVAVDTG